MPIGLKHSEEAKRRIGAGAMGKGRGGFNVRINCPECQAEMSPANLGKHAPACAKTKDLDIIFGFRQTTKEMKIFERTLRTYGLNTAGFMIFWDHQDGKCAICKCSLVGVSEKTGRRTVCIDHCHDTNKVRGLLCSPCNLMIGNADDDIHTLIAAANYLRVDIEGCESTKASFIGA